MGKKKQKPKRNKPPIPRHYCDETGQILEHPKYIYNAKDDDDDDDDEEIPVKAIVIPINTMDFMNKLAHTENPDEVTTRIIKAGHIARDKYYESDKAELAVVANSGKYYGLNATAREPGCKPSGFPGSDDNPSREGY